MQTFLPYRNFARSAACLDNRRLGKQRVEAMQILNILAGKTSAWKHHPAVLMWAGHEKALRQYLRTVILEWKRRGFRNGIRIPAERRLLPHEIPPWLGTRRFHFSHRSHLLRKDPQHYGKMGWKVDLSAPCYWPVRYSPTLAPQKTFREGGAPDSRAGKHAVRKKQVPRLHVIFRNERSRFARNNKKRESASSERSNANDPDPLGMTKWRERPLKCRDPSTSQANRAAALRMTILIRKTSSSLCICSILPPSLE
jgi:hypothetical protein